MDPRVFIISWIVTSFQVTPCPLKNPEYAKKLGMKAHVICPDTHNVIWDTERTDNFRISTDSTAVDNLYRELIKFNCDFYRDNWGAGTDCIESVMWGYDPISQDGKNYPGEVVMQFP